MRNFSLLDIENLISTKEKIKTDYQAMIDSFQTIIDVVEKGDYLETSALEVIENKLKMC